MSCDKHNKHNKREPGHFEEEFRCLEMLRLCSKTYCCYNKTSDNLKFSSKGLCKRRLEQSGDGLLDKYSKVADERVDSTSINRSFRTKNNTVATYDQTIQGLSSFYPKRIAEEDGNHTQPLNL